MQKIETVAETCDVLMFDGGWHTLREVFELCPWVNYQMVARTLLAMWRGGLLERDLTNRHQSVYRSRS